MTTVQFRIDRPSGNRTASNFSFPVVVWVLWPQEERTNYDSPCQCRFVFRVIRESAIEVIEKGAWPKNPDTTCVCACMGEVIE